MNAEYTGDGPKSQVAKENDTSVAEFIIGVLLTTANFTGRQLRNGVG